MHQTGMRSQPELRRALATLLGAAPLTFVDCGARKGTLPGDFRRLRGTRYVGFEADEAECARLTASARRDHVYIPAFLGRTREPRIFHLTTSAACSSFLEPDTTFLAAFGELSEAFRVQRRVTVETVTLDECLPKHNVHGADFVKLDTQGSELDILRGAVNTLQSHTVGIQVEVEFAPMYIGQPLFSDVDLFLRDCGFVLFDLARYRVRRPTIAREIPTRGQLLWGQALYLRGLTGLDEGRRVRLAVVAAVLGVPDLAAEILREVEQSGSATELKQAAARVRALLATAPPRTVLRRVIGRFASADRNISRDRDLWRD
jgi:FkbM family methyltransferase